MVDNIADVLVAIMIPSNCFKLQSSESRGGRTISLLPMVIIASFEVGFKDLVGWLKNFKFRGVKFWGNYKMLCFKGRTDL